MKQALYFNLCLLFFSYSSAMEYRAINTYKNIPLESSTIVQLAPAMPHILEKQVNIWANKEKDLLHVLSKSYQFSTTEKSQLLPERLQAKEIIKNKGYNDTSKYNFIFKVPIKIDEKEYYLRMSGPANKAINLLHSTKNNKGWNMDALTNELSRCPTYQTVSQLAHYLRCKEWLEKNNNDIAIPPVYAAQIPERDSITQRAADDTCFMVQEELTEFVPVRDNPLLLQNVSEQTIAQIIALTKYAGLWDLTPNLLIHKNNSVFGIVDLEQPNNENPDNFFHKNRDKYENNVCCGIKELIGLFKTSPETILEHQQKMLKEIVLRDIELQQWSRAKEVNATLAFIQ